MKSEHNLYPIINVDLNAEAVSTEGDKSLFDLGKLKGKGFFGALYCAVFTIVDT